MPDHLPHRRAPPDGDPAPRSRARTPGVETTSTRRAARRPLQQNLRVLAMVLAVMGVFLFLAYFAANRSWKIKQRRATRHAGSPSTLLAPSGRPGRGLTDWTGRLPSPGTYDADAVAAARILEGRAEAALAAGQTNRAMGLYEEALTKWPDLTSARAALGTLQLKNKDCFRARVTFEKAVQSRPDLPELINALGAAYFCDNNVARAAEEFANALRLNPDYPPALFNLALCHLAKSDRLAGRDALNRFLALQPDAPKGLRQMAFLEASDSRYARALELLRTAIRAAPEWPALFFDAAATASLMGSVGDAISYLEQAERLTSPTAVYVAYQQQAFEQVRASEAGEAFRKSVEERARGRRAEPGLIQLLRGDVEPMLSAEDSW